MVQILIEISSCRDCPFFEIKREYSTDGWDRVSDWHCKKKDKAISNCVDWHETPKVPEWCPVKVKESSSEKKD